MKVTVKKADLLPVLSKVQGLTGRRTNLAITTNVLVKTANKGLSISATDLETGFEGFYEAQVESEGIIAINARKFYEIVRDFPSEDIFLKEVENPSRFDKVYQVLQRLFAKRQSIDLYRKNSLPYSF